jgi:flagellar basal-body rod modification protein FlgD
MSSITASTALESYLSSLSKSSSSSSTSSSTSSSSSGSSEISTESFFKLLAAQLQNQDVSDPMDNSEMMTQITQIAMMQALTNFSTSMDDFSQINTISYGTSMLGKEVLVATSDSSGNITQKTGTVTKVDIYSGTPTLYIDGDTNTGYAISSVMSVGTSTSSSSSTSSS